MNGGASRGPAAPPPAIGPFLGHVTDASARVMLRLQPAPAGAAPPAVIAQVDGLDEPVPLAAWQPGAPGASDGLTFTGDVPLRLGPGAWHAIRLRRSPGGAELGVLKARAAEPASPTGRIAFAFGSCWHPDEHPAGERVMQDLAALARGGVVDHLLLLGDQVYADEIRVPGGGTASQRARVLGTSAPLETRVAPFRAACEQAWRSSALREALSRLPTTMIWDDHELENSFGSTSSSFTDSGRALFEAGAAAYDELQGCRNPPPLVAGSRAWTFRRGPAAFLALDLRTHRCSGAHRLLGEEQRAAVQQFLEGPAREARVLFVLTSVPLLHLPRIIHAMRGVSDVRDQWEFTSLANRSWLVAQLRAFEADGRRRAVLLGGDAHAASAACLVDRAGRATWQLVSSPLAQGLPILLHPVIRLLGQRFHVEAGPSSEPLEARIRRRFSGVNLGVVRGSVTEESIDLHFELYRPGRRTRHVALEARLGR